MNTRDSFPPWASYLLLVSIFVISSLVARWLPLSWGWTVLAAGGIAGILGFMVDLWAKRRAHRSHLDTTGD